MRKLLFLLTIGISVSCFSQTGSSQANAKPDNMKAFFYQLDDQFNHAMATKDSAFFAAIFADSFINCTPVGEINNKAEEIATLLRLPFTQVERTATKFDVFTFSEKVASMSVTKKITKTDSTIVYVRRTIVYQLIDNKWLIASGQGTGVLPKYVVEQ